jgi:hypothetical protein
MQRMLHLKHPQQPAVDATGYLQIMHLQMRQINAEDL